MMYVFLIFILCSLTGISARPGLNRTKRESKIIEGNELSKGATRELPTWPESQDMFHLPKSFGLEDEIVVTVDMGKSKRLNISLVADQDGTETSTICTFVANLNLGKFTLHHNNITDVVPCDSNDFINGTEFQARFKRKENPGTQESDILYIKSFEFESITSMDDIKYIKITGDRIKVKEMKFTFA